MKETEKTAGKKRRLLASVASADRDAAPSAKRIAENHIKIVKKRKSPSSPPPNCSPSPSLPAASSAICHSPPAASSSAAAAPPLPPPRPTAAAAVSSSSKAAAAPSLAGGASSLDSFSRQTVISGAQSPILSSDAIASSSTPSLSSATASSSPSSLSFAADVPQEPAGRRSFSELGLCEELLTAVASLGWTHPTPIQTAVLPVALRRRDVIALAETGSGKTAAFALPVLQQLLESVEQQPQRAVYALVLAPTRELSLQITQHFLALGSAVGCTVATVVGGLDHNSQALALAKKPHVVVGTPGRVLDHLQQTKGFSLRSVKVLVLDEADRLLSLDFDATLQELLQHVGDTSDRQTMLFSATMTTKVSKLQRTSLKSPVKVEVNSKYDVAAHLQQQFILAPARLKHTHLAAALLHLSPSSVIVFTNTCLNARKTALFLRHLGVQTVCLHGKMTQPQRIGALTKFRAAQATCLVATEVGSRGLDIPQVDMVINFDVPLSSKEYIHRVGRTARAGRSGRALTIVTQYDVEAYQRIEHALGKKLEEMAELASPEKVMPLHEKVLEALRSAELEARETDEALLVQKAAKAKRNRNSRKTGVQPLFHSAHLVGMSCSSDKR